MVRSAFKHDSIPDQIPIFIRSSVRILQRRARFSQLQFGARIHGALDLLDDIVNRISVSNNTAFMDVFANEHNGRDYRWKAGFRPKTVDLGEVLSGQGSDLYAANSLASGYFVQIVTNQLCRNFVKRH